jgi:glycosyltransferase involved in cell wall biosynthesis
MSRVGIVMPLAQQRGGAEWALRRFLDGMPAERREAVFVCFLEPGPMVEWSREEGFPTVVIDAGRLRQPLRWAGSVRELRRWLVANRIDVVLSWMAKAHLYAGLAAQLARIPAVWWQHGLPANGGVDLLATLIPARRILACSNAVAAAQRRIWSQRAQLTTIYPPVDLRRVRATPPQRAARGRVGLPADRIVIGIAARLQRWKGVHVLLEAAALLVPRFEHLLFVVVGGTHEHEHDYAAHVQTRAAELGLERHVLFAGHRDNALDWLAAMDIVVSASLAEPFGMVIVEAMALGKPVVATKVAGPLEILTDGVDGVLVEPGNADELALALATLIEAPDTRTRLGAAARARVERYDVPRFVAEVTESLREVAA